MISNDPEILRKQLVDILTSWWILEDRDPAGPSNHGLFERVREALLQERKENEQEQIRHRNSNAVLISLRNEIRGLGRVTHTANKATLAKPGRKSNPNSDRKIVEEYKKGLDDGRWQTQAEYVRKCHPEKSPSWFTRLLKRVKQS